MKIVLTYCIRLFQVTDHDSFTNSPPRIFDLSLDSEDNVNNSRFNSNFQNQNSNGSSTTSSSSPMSSRRDFSSPPSTPGSSTSLPLEAALALGCSFSSLLAGDSASAVSASLDKKISELERLRNKINQESHSSASSTTSSSGSTSGSGSSSSTRSQTSSASSDSSSKVNTSRYKTELCRPFSEHGTCKYGEKCQFAHGQTELRTVTRHPKYKTDLCRTYHSVGFCPYGPRCHFVHNLDEAGTEIIQGPGPQNHSEQHQQQQQPQQQQHQQRQNKPIGSGRLPQHHHHQQQQQQQQQQPQQKAIKPLPMFDNKNSFGNPTWTPLNSNLFEQQQQQNQGGSRNNAARLPVFSTLSK